MFKAANEFQAFPIVKVAEAGLEGGTVSNIIEIIIFDILVNHNNIFLLERYKISQYQTR
jgi:hypothetical protein